MADTIINVTGAERTFVQGEVEVHALRGADLQVQSGEFSVLAGPSGSGKTTLLNLIGCIDESTGGRIEVDGRDVTNMARTEGAKFRLDHIGFVFQAYNLLPVLTAYENAEFVLMLQGVAPAKRKEIVEPLMRRVGLGDNMHRKPHQLSGGQQQRVAVVRAIASKPSIVLADEPTANLDSESSQALLDLMLELNREQGITFLFASHDQMVMDHARRIVRLDSGKVVADERKHAEEEE